MIPDKATVTALFERGFDLAARSLRDVLPRDVKIPDAAWQREVLSAAELSVPGTVTTFAQRTDAGDFAGALEVLKAGVDAVLEAPEWTHLITTPQPPAELLAAHLYAIQRPNEKDAYEARRSGEAYKHSVQGRHILIACLAQGSPERIAANSPPEFSGPIEYPANVSAQPAGRASTFVRLDGEAVDVMAELNEVLDGSE